MSDIDLCTNSKYIHVSRLSSWDMWFKIEAWTNAVLLLRLELFFNKGLYQKHMIDKIIYFAFSMQTAVPIWNNPPKCELQDGCD